MNARAVIDTNVLFASQHSKSPESPNAEILGRWQANEFTWLFSRDTIGEYARKLIELGISAGRVQSFLARLIVAGEEVRIAFFHQRRYPADPDDIAFLLCAINGGATHLVTYDRHLAILDGEHDFRICGAREFLADLDSE